MEADGGTLKPRRHRSAKPILFGLIVAVVMAGGATAGPLDGHTMVTNFTLLKDMVDAGLTFSYNFGAKLSWCDALELVPRRGGAP